MGGAGGDKKGKEKAPKAEKKEEPAADEIPMEPKKKDPMDALPKGTFDLEEWKRFIPTMMKTPPSHGSGSTLTMKTTPSGEAITSTMMSSLWSSCLAIS